MGNFIKNHPLTSIIIFSMACNTIVKVAKIIKGGRPEGAVFITLNGIEKPGLNKDNQETKSKEN